MKCAISQADEHDINFMLEIDKLFFKEYLINLDGSFDEKIWREYLRQGIPRVFVIKKSK